jgi:signal transduction histidine kinase
MYSSRRHYGPPWSHTGERWPGHRRWSSADRHGRRRFFRRIAFAAFALLLLGVAGASSLTWFAITRFGLSPWMVAIPVLVVVFVAMFVVRRAFGAFGHFTLPLNAVMEAADRVAEGDYAVRVPEQGAPPMRALTRSFNTMTERLAHADRQRRDLMADLAHELRTPLTVLQGRLEGLVDGVYPRDDNQLAQLLDQTQVLSRLIEDLRTLALSDAGVLSLEKESTDVVKLARDVARSFEAEAAAKSIPVSVHEPGGPIWLDLDHVRMREVLANLLSNAIRHTPDGGSVEVSVSDSGERVSVAVKDTGEGLPPDVVARMFDRFYKGPNSHGSGLGLAIARSLVTAHGGEISATSQLGAGTTVTVTLPRVT